MLDLTVKDVERIWIQLPYRDTPERNMARELPHFNLMELCIVRLACGVVGYGETMPYYNRDPVTDQTVRSVYGKHAVEVMWDDALGHGLQMALFDAVGKAMEVPCHRLLGGQRRDRAFVSWWVIDMSAEDMLHEAQEAIRQGYTNLKAKARPWYDLREQCRLLAKELPDWFEVDLDFNGMAVDAGRAARLLEEIERFDNIAIFETPIPHADAVGYRHLRGRVNTPLAVHYGTPSPATTLRDDLCDGFVMTGGATRVVQGGAVAAAGNKPFFVQVVGSDITMMWGVHLAAVLSHAQWPAVSCSCLFTHTLVQPQVEVFNGTVAVPDRPGLGVDINWDAVEDFRIQPIEKPQPDLLIAINWPSGAVSYYTDGKRLWPDFLEGRLPVFVPGVTLESVPDDGSDAWKALQARARLTPVHSGNALV